jgi:hypothetical protein
MGSRATATWRSTISRRALLRAALGALGVSGATSAARVFAAAAELQMPQETATVRFDFEAKGLEGWTTLAGQWGVEQMPGAPSGRSVLAQRATQNEFNVIVAPPGPYSDVDVSVAFKPIAGREDASGGIVFRFKDGVYYVVRANALEDNLRLYYYDRGRRQIATARVKAPTLGEWHVMRLVTVGDRMQAWLDGALHLDHRDARLTVGRVGLWTKADSITAFDDLVIRGVTRDR